MIIKLTGIAFAGILMIGLVQKYAPQFTVLAQTATGICLILGLREEIQSLVVFFTRLMESSGEGAQYTTVLLQTLGIAVLCQGASQTAKDAGLSSLALKVELGGQILIAVQAVPIVKALVQVITELIHHS